MSDNFELQNPSVKEKGYEAPSPIQAARDEMELKLAELQNTAGNIKELDAVRIASDLSLDYIKALGEYVADIDAQKLAVIADRLTLEQIHYIGANVFAHNEMTPEKIQLLGKFTADQLEAFCVGGNKGGEILYQLEVSKINDLGGLHPETIYALTHSRRKELITSSANSHEWRSLISFKTNLSLGHIKALDEYVMDIDAQKLEVIGNRLTPEQIHYIGANIFAHSWMTPEKIQLLGKFTADQLEAFCIGDDKAGLILVQLDITKIQDLDRLSPETIYVLAHSKRKELITSSPGSKEWKALMSYNIDYPGDL